MKRYIRAVLAGVAALLLAFTASTAATASDDLWPETADCAAGAFTGHAVTGPPNVHGPMMDLSGWVGSCPPDGKDPAPPMVGEFGFAYLGLGSSAPDAVREGVLFANRLRPYESAMGQTPFVGRIDFHVARKAGIKELPICLMRDAESRVACVLVVLVNPDVATVTPVAVTDSRVLGRVTVTMSGPGMTPNCATCL